MHRSLAIAALVLSALGAASLLLIFLIVSSSDYLEPSVDPEMVMFGAAVALGGAAVAVQGLVKRSPATARWGAGAQAAAVVLISGAYLTAPDPEGAGAALYWVLYLTIGLDITVLLAAGRLCRRAHLAARR